MKISASLIVKNESSCLEKCLKSLKGFDEIIVVDTGSTDDTYVIARNWADRVYTDYKWNDNFAEARNHALSKTTGDWIFTIDADEELLTDPKYIKSVAEDADKRGLKAISIIQEGNNGDINYSVRLYKRCPEVYWCGAIHNYLSIGSQSKSDIKIRYGYSAAHQLDPDRSLRILKREVAKGDKSRELYYLAREYWYRKDYITAIYWLNKHVHRSTFLAERAEAYLMMARCYWALREGELARVNCLQALSINANFKEALNFMAELSWEHNAVRWREFAELATNENVLFMRGKEEEPIIKRRNIININDASHFDNYWKNKGLKIDESEPIRSSTMMKHYTGGRFLDAGCGLSPLCKMALAIKGSEVYGLDISPLLIESLKKQFPEINYLIGDVNELPYEDNFFDYVVMGEVIEHMELPKKTLAGVMKVIKPGGMLVFSIPNNDNGGYAVDWHLWTFNKKGIEGICNEFGNVKIEHITENKHRWGHLVCFISKK